MKWQWRVKIRCCRKHEKVRKRAALGVSIRCMRLKFGGCFIPRCCCRNGRVLVERPVPATVSEARDAVRKRRCLSEMWGSTRDDDGTAASRRAVDGRGVQLALLASQACGTRPPLAAGVLWHLVGLRRRSKGAAGATCFLASRGSSASRTTRVHDSAPREARRSRRDRTGARAVSSLLVPVASSRPPVARRRVRPPVEAARPRGSSTSDAGSR